MSNDLLQRTVPRAAGQRSGGGPRLGSLFLIGLVAVGGYGGYFGYCRYQVGQKQKALIEAARSLRQTLLRVRRPIGPEDIRAVAVGFAAAASVEVDPAAIQPVIEPLTAANIGKLPKAAAMAIGIVTGLPKHRTPHYLVGFSARFRARHGVARVDFIHAWYSYIEDDQVQR